MTSEIGILNKHGVALAADSAVTIDNGKKYYNTVNKLFTLSKYYPVGIMIYSKAEYMGYPVEILVKEYRKALKDKAFDTLIEYWDDFLGYLNNHFKSENNINEYIQQVQSFLISMDSFIREEVNKNSESFSRISKDEIQGEVKKIIHNVIENTYNEYTNLDNDEKFLPKYDIIKSKAKDLIVRNIEEIIGTFNDEDMEKLLECCIMILTKKHRHGGRTGIVIAGYGEKELYPRLINGEFLGSYFGETKYFIRHIVDVTNDNDAGIVPFAQDDVIATFMNGIDGYMINEILDTLEELKSEIDEDRDCSCNADDCVDKFKGKILDKIKETSLEMHWGPILQTVSVAPKEELAHMAETLVNLTSFRRNLSMDSYSQTVGGPIDVAIITKGDGFIWIKRKHYFQKDYNPNFFHNYYR